MTYSEIQDALKAFPKDQFVTIVYGSKTYFGIFQAHKDEKDEAARNLWQFEIRYPSGNTNVQPFKGDTITSIAKAYPDTAFKK